MVFWWNNNKQNTKRKNEKPPHPSQCLTSQQFKVGDFPVV